MTRKWTLLAAMVAATTMVAAGLGAATDEDSPLHKIMEKIQSKNVAITKGVRSLTNFKKAQKEVATSAEDLAKLAKEAKPIHDAVKKAKDNKDATVANWDKFMDEFIKTSDDLAKLASKPDAKHEEAKKAHSAVKKACADCHGVFKIEEENFK